MSRTGRAAADVRDGEWGTSFVKITEADHSKEDQSGSDQDLIHRKVIGYKV
jgi:hypothetical protein